MPLPKKEKLLLAIESFGFAEKVIFYVLVFAFLVSALFLLRNANDLFTMEIPADGGELREGVIGYPRYINPLISVTETGRDLSQLIYSGLFTEDEKGEIVPSLAKSYTVSDDGLIYTVVLKDNIFFHDGYPVKAEDVEFTIKKALDPVIKSPKAPAWEGVLVKVINEKEIEFNLKHEYAPFIQNLTLGILPKHIWKNVESEAFPFSQFNIEPIGSGPYKIKETKSNSAGLPEYYHLIPFNDFALGRAHISDLYVYFFTNEENLMNAYENGIINSLNSISPENAKTLSIADGNVLETPLPRIFAVFFNQNESKVFLNKEVRVALNESVDKDAIIDEVLHGYGTKIDGPLPYDTVAESSTSTPSGKIEYAKNILAKAGWTKGEGGILSKKIGKDVESLSFSISTTNSPELKKAAELLKQTWENLGAKVEIKVYELGDLQQNVIRPRRYDALLFGEVIGKDHDLFAFWHSSERNDPGLNLSMYTNVKADKFLTDARSTKDPEEKEKLILSFEKEVANDVPAIFLYSPDFIYIVPEELKGISLDKLTSSSERFTNVEKWYLKTERIWPIFNNL